MKKQEKNRTAETVGKCENRDTELVFIIDESGSMAGYGRDTVGGFNSMIEKERREGEGQVFVSTVLFNNRSRVLHDRIEIDAVEPMGAADYLPCGCTALLDALGDAIRHIGNIHKYARKEDVPKNTVFVITTDGMENASRRYTKEQVRAMISRQTEKYGWEFIFVAANIDAVEAAGEIGIRRERAANYTQTTEGFAACYEAMSEFVSMKRAGVAMENDEEWKSSLSEDK